MDNEEDQGGEEYAGRDIEHQVVGSALEGRCDADRRGESR
jgi:hypothetical protein